MIYFFHAILERKSQKHGHGSQASSLETTSSVLFASFILQKRRVHITMKMDGWMDLADAKKKELG
jgi:hypothetical protein